ncbi:hypothetical protein FJZ36_10240 [Candidatus Poribacteria bacterium]|nr:hypothetical protein [Candidatus Poribacteria bacterium]
MSKRVETEIDVDAPDGVPTALRFSSGASYSVAVIDTWVETGIWWHGESPKRFYRLEGTRTASKGLFVVYRDEVSGAWHLYRVFD